ncbi:4Fe-4S dicluster domain-containing protein [Maritimibacter sp. DP07]|uniref:4Fe-4S dicluster domain-containing protein n=1 Tax=Maritimibacter harenae TaxID=2606218 RepID=A0A845M970_9RHOB|nr:4Fe-4S dicluster domain-containing protein [Maritimibacter harenae]MZR13374.1 4Fe-4S dicluster domain-containing protein [Maritimibacter harenae]
MPRISPYRPFTPDPDQMQLWPDVSGNRINGLGETTRRRPRLVYWAPDPDTIPHGAMQRWFYAAAPDHPALHAARRDRQKVLDAPLADLAKTREDRAPEAWTAALDDFVRDGHCEMTGVAEMSPEWVFEGHEISQSRVIMLAVRHDHERLSQAPEPEAGAEVVRQYGRAAGAAKSVASWLRARGWEAQPVTGPMTGALALIPPAIACGLGELGKHGSLINAELGSNFRLAAVLTDAPFAPTPPRKPGVDDFCLNCRICEDACPPEAISQEKQTVRGEEKWYVDFDRCLPFFNETQGCAVCIAVCPWSRPGVGQTLAAKLARRRDRTAAE